MQNDNDDPSLLKKFKQGDKEAANELIAKYFDRVYRAAEKRLAQRSGRVSGPDDVAVSVFESLWQRAQEKRFDEDDLASTDELWRLLSRMIQFKTDDHARKATAQKRGSGAVRGESIFTNANDSMPGIDGQGGTAMTPDQIMELEEGYVQLMDRLPDEDLQKIAVMRMENFKVAEISAEFQKSERWVKRKLAIIRDLWTVENQFES